jgi:cytochrome b
MTQLDRTAHAATAAREVRAWDLPTRLFKWSLVALVAGSWVSYRFADFGLVWHRFIGYAILILLTFRLFWGLVGSSTARFTAWVSAPWTALRYGLDVARGRARPYLSHNPLGAWMIIVLMLAVGAQGLAGLFTVDSNGVFGGPFAQLDPLEDPTRLQRALSSFHHQAYYWLLGLIALHVAVNLFYQFGKGDPIVKAMITGRKPVEPFADQPEMRPARGEIARALACLALAALVVLGTVKVLGGQLL